VASTSTIPLPIPGFGNIDGPVGRPGSGL